MRDPILVALAWASFLVVPCHAEPAFIGYIVDGSRTLLALRETPDSAPQWVRAGEHFGPYIVEAFDRAAGSATLRREGTRIILRLPQSRVVPKVDIATMEAFAANGNQRVASLLNAYRQIEALRERLTTSAASDGRHDFEFRQQKAQRNMDVMLSNLFDRMQAEVAKLPSPFRNESGENNR